MSLSERQICSLKATVIQALTYLDGEEEQVKRALLMYASANGKEEFLITKQALDQVKTITELLLMLRTPSHLFV